MRPPAARRADAELLNGLLDLERRTIGAYTAGIPLLTGASLTAAQRFLAQELAHAAELSRLLKRAGVVAHRPSDSYDLGHPRSAAAVLGLLHASETAQLAAYITAIPRLATGTVRASTASILADDAQHVSVLRSALALDPVPTAFVTGRE
ncbi:MAG: ferritin-like domain-containing protein [Solirubrobacteraceae bacterium]